MAREQNTLRSGGFVRLKLDFKDWLLRVAATYETGCSGSAELLRKDAIKTLLNIFRQRRWLCFTEDLDSLAGSVHYYSAVLAVLQVTGQVCRQIRIQFTVQVVGEFENYFLTKQGFVLS